MLNNAIALIAVAALFGVEAIKVKERLPRIIFAAIAVFFTLWAVLVEQIADAWPKVGAFVTDTFEQPVSWFILAVALFFVLRPFWLRGAVGRNEDSREPEPSKVSIRLPTENTKQREEINGLKDSLAEVAKVVTGLLESQTEMNKALGDKTKELEQELPTIRSTCRTVILLRMKLGKRDWAT